MMMGGGAANIISASKLAGAATAAPGIAQAGALGSSLTAEIDGVMALINHPIVQPLLAVATDYIRAQTDALSAKSVNIAAQEKHEEYNPVLYGAGGANNKSVFRYD